MARLLLLHLLGLSSAVLVDFRNCIDPSILSSPALQFVPLFVDARYDSVQPDHALNITVSGNVTGSRTGRALPPPSDRDFWGSPNITEGKIPDTDPSWQGANGQSIATTLLVRTDVLTYTPWNEGLRFCNQTGPNSQCPLAPVFTSNVTDPRELRSFNVSHSFFSSYAFTTFATTLRITSGSVDKQSFGCISANLTPDLGSAISGALTYVPLVILILVGVATAFAANFSPWGTTNLYRWSTNWGRDEDILRLVTPGFGDCLQYIQFIVLTGSLSLSYPGYFQPVVSSAAWSILMFPSNFVSKQPFYKPVHDGLYAYRVMTHDGLDRMSQLAGIAEVQDIWASMIIWLLVILGSVILICQTAAGVMWLLRKFGGIIEQDRRRKSLPFTVGMVVRIIFGWLLLPIISLSTYEFVISAHQAAPVSLVVVAAIITVVLLVFVLYMTFFIGASGSTRSTKTRASLFDDLPTLLQYGPLYNTFRDDAALFAVVPLFMAFMRGIAIGALQPSGIAQIILLAICEVLYLLVLNSVRPYYPATSMNAYDIAFSSIRLITILLSVAFSPSLGVSEASKGWIGFIILLLHAIVLVFGFFLNALQAIVEVGARLAGAGGDQGAQRGGLVRVFGNRQLRRREVRRDSAHFSVGSRATQLMSDHKMDRPRSTSGSSALLLATTPRSAHRLSQFDGSSQATSEALRQAFTGSSSRQSPAESPSEPDGTFNFTNSDRRSRTISQGSAQLLNSPNSLAPGSAPLTKPISDPYFRPPRARRPTLQDPSQDPRGRASWTSGDWANHRWNQAMGGSAVDANVIPDEQHRQRRGSLIPSIIHDGYSDPNLNRPRADYATREVDYYYGVRGPALSEGPTRKLHTGPADPTGPVASATSWVRNLLAGRKKDKGKGFEVVRSTRAPPIKFSPNGTPLDEESGQAKELDMLEGEEPYTDSPDLSGPVTRHRATDSQGSDAPTLPEVDTGGALNIPSRVGSKTSGSPSRRASKRSIPPPLHSASLAHPPSAFRSSSFDPPAVPRKSSKRHSPSNSLDRATQRGNSEARGEPEIVPPPLNIGIADDSDNDSNHSTKLRQEETRRSQLGLGSQRPSRIPVRTSRTLHRATLSTESAATGFASNRSSLRSSVGESLLLGPLSASAVPEPTGSPNFHLRNPYSARQSRVSSEAIGGQPLGDDYESEGSDIGDAHRPSSYRDLIGSPHAPDFEHQEEQVRAMPSPGYTLQPTSSRGGSIADSTRSFAMRASAQSGRAIGIGSTPRLGTGQDGDEEEALRPMSVGRVRGEGVIRIVTPDPGSRESLALQNTGSRATVESVENGGGHAKKGSSLSEVFGPTG